MAASLLKDLIRRVEYHLWYYRRPPWDTGVTPPELEEFIRRHPPGRALDLGCGSGTNLVRLAQAGWQVTGVDFAWRAVRLARKRLEQAGIQAEVLLGDVADLNGVRGLYDLILDIGCYHSLSRERRSAYQQNLARLLAQGGTVLLYAHCRRAGAEAGHGWSAEDEEQFARFLRLIHKQIGQEGTRGPSVWMVYQRDGS